MKVKVKNRSKSTVGYNIPEDRIFRSFAPGETKEIEVAELEKVNYQPGGSVILNEYLLINDAEIAEKFNTSSIEPEYWMTETEVIDLMKYGSLDKFLDCLDFAPEGVIDLIKSLAVSMPLNDMAKCEAIHNKFGFNVVKAIQLDKESKETDVEDVPSAKNRRVAVETEKKSTGRRAAITEETAVNKYKVVYRAE